MSKESLEEIISLGKELGFETNDKGVFLPLENFNGCEWGVFARQQLPRVYFKNLSGISVFGDVINCFTPNAVLKTLKFENSEFVIETKLDSSRNLSSKGLVQAFKFKDVGSVDKSFLSLAYNKIFPLMNKKLKKRFGIRKFYEIFEKLDELKPLENIIGFEDYNRVVVNLEGELGYLFYTGGGNDFYSGNLSKRLVKKFLQTDFFMSSPGNSFELAEKAKVAVSKELIKNYFLHNLKFFYWYNIDEVLNYCSRSGYSGFFDDPKIKCAVVEKSKELISKLELSSFFILYNSCNKFGLSINFKSYELVEFIRQCYKKLIDKDLIFEAAKLKNLSNVIPSFKSKKMVDAVNECYKRLIWDVKTKEQFGKLREFSGLSPDFKSKEINYVVCLTLENLLESSMVEEFKWLRNYSGVNLDFSSQKTKKLVQEGYENIISSSIHSQNYGSFLFLLKSFKKLTKTLPSAHLLKKYYDKFVFTEKDFFGDYVRFSNIVPSRSCFNKRIKYLNHLIWLNDGRDKEKKYFRTTNFKTAKLFEKYYK